MMVASRGRMRLQAFEDRAVLRCTHLTGIGLVGSILDCHLGNPLVIDRLDPECGDLREWKLRKESFNSIEEGLA